MSVKKDFIELIGNTPMLRLNAASERTGCEILGKCEFLNPGGSVKDRAALFMVRDAVEKGQLKPGGVIVEGTAGNTGIGIALVANARGYKTVIVMPDNQSKEKMDTLRALGGWQHYRIGWPKRHRSAPWRQFLRRGDRNILHNC